MIRHLILVAALAGASAAVAAPRVLSGKPINCIPLNRVTDQRVVDESTILFKVNQRWYRNDIVGGCPGLAAKRSFSSRTPTARLCAGEPIQVFDSRDGVARGGCSIGQFTEIPRPTR